MDEHKHVASSVHIDGTVQGLVQGEHNTIVIATPQPDRVRDQDRQHFLAYLCARYHNVLEDSLKGAALMALGLHTKPEALRDPARLIFRHLNQTERVLPPGTSITEIYDQSAGELLILGEPGAGKSILLVHLAQGLLTRAERDSQQLLPVIFNLSSWAQKRLSLDEWLVEELRRSYLVSRKVGKLWVQNKRILPLLDGLDEVAASARDSCIGAINTYRCDHLVSLVVCSRITEYLSQEDRLVLQNAVVVQPLTTEQVDTYLEAAGPSLAAVRIILQKNQVLRELAASPLMLNVLTLTYRDTSTSILPTSGSVEEQQRQVFASYIERMLDTNEPTQNTSPQQMLSWLIWLARQMQRHSQTEFYLEQLQPSWLFFGPSFEHVGGFLNVLLVERSSEIQPADRLVWSWRSLGKSLFSKRHIDITLGISVLIGLIWGLDYGLSAGLSAGLNIGLNYWLVLGLFQGVASEAVDAQQRCVPNQGIRVSLYNGIIMGLVSTVIIGLVAFLSTDLFFGLSYGLTDGLVMGLGIGLLAGLFNGGLAYLQHYILRFLLWQKGLIPWKFSQFLDEAERDILLRKVGGGYIFIHRLFLDYIASLDTTQEQV